MAFSDGPRFLEAAIKKSDYSVVITTGELAPPGPVFVHANDAFTRMTGYTREELLGATPRILQGPDTDRAVLNRLKSNLRAGDSFEGRTWNYRKDGTPYLVEWTITRLRNDGEGADYFFSVQQEVTDLHPPQDRLEGQTRKLNVLLNSTGASHDPITGALNHRGMLLRLQRLIDETAAAHSVTGIVSLQFRRLDRIDQAFGVEAINQLLCDISERLESRLEATESLARSHAHTFAAVIPADAGAASDPDSHLMTRARALVAAVTETGFEVGGESLQIEVSAGIARAPTDGRHARELALLAEELTDGAANTDVDSIRWADHGIKETQRCEIKLEADLQRAVTERELVLFYQPVMDLDSGEAVGAEALARWPQPDGHAPIGPDRFIPLAEELGLMDELGEQVFENACRQLRRWQELPGNAAFWVSVNVAPSQLRDPTLVERFIAITQATGVSPACVKLEITESALEFGLDEVSHVIVELAAAGFPLALDDFGTGYSSLGRLIDMPFNLIKVDKVFIWQTPDGRGAGVVASLSQLSSHLQIDALGEGVETAAQEAFLRTLNYRYAQGFFYAKPMAAADFVAWAGWPAD
ncbi:EAL domain-containing protein [Halomonas campisalis]|uniref:EAL domain-containing protein n=1 Tax=Billgrantia campisalis TaxID=74661 RepID=A0ABS9P870_9GAMM|nr:EAL domain-containing protein [Halomonas campisalis]MCG6657976.1 EAL domain-containing protein [Halomonas campisalis]MDR5863499.1 EAL domain-containing protein [Halomonas campisalis]